MLKPRHTCFCLAVRLYHEIDTGGPQGFGGVGGEGLYIFRELCCTGNYFRDLRSKLIGLEIWGALQKKVKNEFMNSYLKGKAIISFNCFFNSSASEGKPSYPPWKI